ncbi:MAG: 2-phospho-L-lactate guanylyltransferase, partial [Phycisphaerae bacterium]|nr:2-phospho-L-lactate guanylyltransferase [Phycisphaerae bacterium]NIP51101.1 2-phospho-L-lactate guanylyltransferase [Phycisphaerae bacterium]NIW97501.1 2-phospho-L-lactate guanylyltransferase [Phycisphaerae bacterium]NIX27027.1 2-phospho-L-lactate guanylyltransferase [Phycisphaerae bacterium]
MLGVELRADMKFVIVPVKDLSKAKERLSSIMPQEERTALAYAMLEDVLSALKGSKLPYRKFIVTLDAGAIEIAKRLGIEVIPETEQKGESASVDYASQVCMEMGAKSVLVIPGDAPLITSGDIDYILGREKGSPSIVFVPARDKLGTNAFLRNPPDAIPSMFGHDSFNKHKDEADRCGIPYVSFENPRIALDIDNPEDLREFMSQESSTKAYRQL